MNERTKEPTLDLGISKMDVIMVNLERPSTALGVTAKIAVYGVASGLGTLGVNWVANKIKERNLRKVETTNVKNLRTA